MCRPNWGSHNSFAFITYYFLQHFSRYCKWRKNCRNFPKELKMHLHEKHPDLDDKPHYVAVNYLDLRKINPLMGQMKLMKNFMKIPLLNIHSSDFHVFYEILHLRLNSPSLECRLLLSKYRFFSNLIKCQTLSVFLSISFSEAFFSWHRALSHIPFGKKSIFAFNEPLEFFSAFNLCSSK